MPPGSCPVDAGERLPQVVEHGVERTGRGDVAPADQDVVPSRTTFVRKDQPGAFRVVGDLTGADTVMSHGLFLGTYPGLTPAMLDYEIEVIDAFCRSR